ncbi:MAG: hypothetical protein Q4P07_04130 [Ornithinimicrobium sp.]|uniref:hypothetical protein n=1 Tax=Ornithinimicrobium sp. TaxID=1977084 RepID=UPI0026E0D89A|nr:hypothetical protein [Ornithinimicrobium sp.]MDO5739318.1 hypothetical protein [Ornithinimicrobium sp.]
MDRFGQVPAAAFARRLPALVGGIVGRWDLTVEDLYEAGPRVPRVIASEAGAVLMERIVPGHPVASLRAAPPTPAQWAELLRDVHGTTVTGVEGFLEERCEEMFERIGARQAGPKVRPYVPRPAWEAAVRTGGPHDSGRWRRWSDWGARREWRACWPGVA